MTITMYSASVPRLVNLLGHSMPNVHFHAVTAYNILRQNEVGIGKRDFLGNP